MSETFAYRAIEVGGAARPALDVTIRIRDRVIAARALVDSGADRSLMPLEWSARLGLASEMGRDQLIETASGFGRLTAYDVAADVEIRESSRCVRVGVALADGVPFMLLGRADFFRTFRVLFDERAQTLTLTEYDDEPPLAFAA